METIQISYVQGDMSPQNIVYFLQTVGGKNVVQGRQLLFCDVLRSLDNSRQSLFISCRATSVPRQHTMCEDTLNGAAVE